MGQKVCANNIIKTFRMYTGEPSMKLTDVHRLLARYGVKPIVTDSKKGPLYDWDDVSMALNSIHWDRQSGKFQFKYPEKPKFNPNEIWPDETENCRAPEENMDYFVNRDVCENMKKSRRKIFLSEEQISYIKDKLNEGKHPVDPNKVLTVKKYLDGNFKRGYIDTMSEDGYPTKIKIVALLNGNGEAVKNLSDIQLFELLQDKFQHLYDDTEKRDSLLKQIIKDWYKNKISKHGMLTVNFI